MKKLLTILIATIFFQAEIFLFGVPVNSFVKEKEQNSINIFINSFIKTE